MPGMYAFDTLAFSKKLKSAGYTEPQAEALAEAQSEVFREMLESTLATKEDLRALQAATKEDLRELESSVKEDIRVLETSVKEDIRVLETSVKADVKRLEGEIQDLRTELKGDIRELRADLDTLGLKLTIRLSAIVVAALGAMSVIFRFFLLPGG